MPSGQLDDYERDLFTRAEQWPMAPCWRELNQRQLADIASREGIDFATALLYLSLRRSAEHGPGIAMLDDGIVANGPDLRTDNPRLSVAIVPGGCHEENTDSRAALQLVHDEIVRQGLPAEIVPVQTFGTLPEQAAIISAWLESRADGNLILVSLSKGTAEVKLALKHQPGAFRRVSAWVNISGLFFGSEWVRWLLDRRISRWSAHGWCWYWRYPFTALEQLRRGPHSLLDFDLSPPAHLRMIHILGLPLSHQLTHKYSRRIFYRLTPLGPNDGMGFMAGDVVRLPGQIYPVWGADHFLRARGLDMRDFVRRVLHYLASGMP